MHTTSVSLLERLREPTDNAAWSRFAAFYSPLLFYWARRVGLQDSDAADLVQEVLAHLLLKLRDFEYDQNQTFRGWLRTVTLNIWRAKRRRRTLPLEPGGDENLDAVADDASNAFWDKEYHQHLVARALDVMQAEFEPNTWKACWATVVDQRPVADVARELGISPGAVYVAKSKILKRLRDELAGLWD